MRINGGHPPLPGSLAPQARRSRCGEGPSGRGPAEPRGGARWHSRPGESKQGGHKGPSVTGQKGPHLGKVHLPRGFVSPRNYVEFCLEYGPEGISLLRGRLEGREGRSQGRPVGWFMSFVSTNQPESFE